MKCLSHKDGQRGVSNMYPPPLLDCGCPLEMAALEFWLSKISQTEIGRGSSKNQESKAGALNSKLLSVIETALRDVSGHATPTLLQPRLRRLEHTAIWALDEIACQVGKEETVTALQQVKAGFKKAMEGINSEHQE